jgi:predicted GNAT family N-acyltransferase
MNGDTRYSVRIATWTNDEAALRAIRHAVFVVEQDVPEVLEWDDVDASCVHALALAPDGKPIGCGRLLPDGHIGRMAVLAAWRGRGVGATILATLTEQARERGHARTILNAQVNAIPFYERYGYAATSEVFEEAGIPHRVMVRTLR